MITTGRYKLFIYAWDDDDSRVVVTSQEIKNIDPRGAGLKLLKRYDYATIEQRTDALSIAFRNERGREETLRELERMAS